MVNKHSLLALLTSASLSPIIAYTPAMAQEAPEARSRMADIVVTAQRREQRLQDVPLSVSAIGSEQLRNQGVNNLLDLGAGRVASLTIVSVFGVETAVAINVRGFGANDAVQGTVELPVALYVDGVPFPRAQGNSLDLVTPERVEVLRGPQGQLFGRNSEAGAVQIISKRPSGELSGRITSGIGNFGLFSTKGYIDLPAFGNFKVQLSGNYRRHGGYFKNARNSNLQNVNPWVLNPAMHFQFKTGDYDKDFNRLTTYGGRAAVEYDGGPFNAYYTFDYTKAKDDQGIPYFRNSPKAGTIFNPPGGTGPNFFFSNGGVGGTPLVLTEAPLTGTQVPSRASFYPLPALPFYTTAYGHMLNLSYEMTDELTLRSITGSRYVRRYGATTLPPSVNLVLPSSAEYVRSRSFSQELQAIYDSEHFDITVGGIYFNEKIIDEREAGFAANCLSFFPAAFCTPNGAPSRPVYNLGLGSAAFKRSFSETNVYGLYAQATYIPPILDDKLELTAGVRYSHDKKVGHRPIDFGLNPTTGVVNLSNRFKTSRVDPAFTVKYNINDDINVYARYAIGYRDGGSSVRSPTFGAFNEDEMTSWEVGFKSELFDKRLRVNAAAFYNRIKNELISLQSNPTLSPALTDTFNSPATRKIKGFEVEATAALVAGLTLTGNYTFLDANTVPVGLDAVLPGQLTSSFLVTGSWSDATGIIPDAATILAHPNSTIILAGPQSAPRHSGSVALDYVADLNTAELAFHVDWTKSTRQFSGNPQIYQTTIVNGVVTPLARYNSGTSMSRVNASLSFRKIALAETTAEIRLWMKNVFNHADGAFAFSAGNGISAATPHPNSILFIQPPRTMGAELTINF